MTNSKQIIAINLETGEEVIFKSRIEMAKHLGVDRMTVTRQLINKNKILLGIWKLKNPQNTVIKHIAWQLENKKIKQCPKCKATLSLDTVHCPICYTKQQ